MTYTRDALDAIGLAWTVSTSRQLSRMDIPVGVLGLLHLDIGGQPVTINAERERTLVAALALTPGHPAYLATIARAYERL